MDDPGYFEVWVLFEGALGAEDHFTLDSDVDNWADAHLQAGAKANVLTEVYCRFHPHREGIECECAQYDTNHHPMTSFEPMEDA